MDFVNASLKSSKLVLPIDISKYNLPEGQENTFWGFPNPTEDITEDIIINSLISTEHRGKGEI